MVLYDVECVAFDWAPHSTLEKYKVPTSAKDFHHPESMSDATPVLLLLQSNHLAKNPTLSQAEDDCEHRCTPASEFGTAVDTN